MLLDRLRRLPNPYLYDYLFHGKGDADTAVAVGLEGGVELDESGPGFNDTTFTAGVPNPFDSGEEEEMNAMMETNPYDMTDVPKRKKKAAEHTHVFKYRGKNSAGAPPLIAPVHEYGAARRALKRRQQQEEKLQISKNIMINNTKKQLGEFRGLVTLLHRDFDAQVGDENNTTGVVENEILKKHLLEGIMSHRAIMKRPRAKPPLAMASAADAHVDNGAPVVAGGMRDGMSSFVDGLPNYL